MRNILIVGIILLILSCGGPEYPEDKPSMAAPKIEDTTATTHVKTTEDIVETADTFQYLTDMKIRYYEQVRPVIVHYDGEDIIVDGNAFRILLIATEVQNKDTIVTYEVQSIAGSLSTVEQIRMQYNNGLQSFEMSPLGIFSKMKPVVHSKLHDKKKEAAANFPSDKKIKIHVVGSGDNLSDIARMYHMKLSTLRELNEETLKGSSRIYPGQKLKYYEQSGTK